MTILIPTSLYIHLYNSKYNEVVNTNEFFCYLFSFYNNDAQSSFKKNNSDQKFEANVYCYLFS